MGKFEIMHYNKSNGRIQYNSYHNCESIEDAIKKHEQKGFFRYNIRGITHHIKKKYSEAELIKVIYS